MRNFQLPGRSPAFSKQGMVATSHPIACTVGIEILKRGGNAIDAAIAMSFVLPICEPQSTGLFGDVFAMIKLSNSDNIIGLNGSGKAPMKISSEVLRGNGLSKIPEDGVESITMPGAIAALESLNEKYGTFDLNQLTKPAIDYATNGIVISPRVAFDWNYSFKNLKGVAKDIYSDKGKPYSMGSIFKSPGQAEVLKKIAHEGATGFYDGEVADDFITSLSKLGGVHSYDDLKAVSVEYIDPVKFNFQGYELFEMPPNGQGITAILMTKMLEKLNISNLTPDCSERIHLEAEVAKLAYHNRDSMIADPKFFDLSYDHFFSDEVVNNLISKISTDKVLPHNNFQNYSSHKDTVYLTVVDKDRNMISLIFSIFNSFGSGFASEKYGILFHNRGAGFSIDAGHPNEIMGGKRPLHTIIPAFLTKKNEFTMPFGVMGGQYQANGHARLISNMVHFGMDIQESIDTPRSFPEDGFLKLEVGYSDLIAKELNSKGHKIIRPDQPIGGAQAILHNKVKDTLVGGSDPRKDGFAIGY